MRIEEEQILENCIQRDHKRTIRRLILVNTLKMNEEEEKKEEEGRRERITTKVKNIKQQ